MNFKLFLEDEETIKGAFKEFPPEQQPVRIPLSIFPALSAKVVSILSKIGKAFVPDANLKNTGEKTTTGDLDVVFVPNSKNWKQDVLNTLPGIVVYKTNGPQLMMVVGGLVDDQQYMIDLLITSPEDFEFRKMYHGFGTLIPAVIGSFGRSLGYKFGFDGLYARIKDAKNNYHNIKLSSDPSVVMDILMLDKSKLGTGELYTAEGVANWVINSPRFDTGRWLAPPQTDGQTIVTRNHKSHRAAKKKDEVIDCYALIDSVKKSATFDNSNYEIERRILGSDFVDKMLNPAIRAAKRFQILSGSEIMTILGIPAGPDVGRWVKFIEGQPEFAGVEEVTPVIKERAKQILLKAANAS